jgi:tRNA(Ile)-lysidine synthase
LQEAGVPPWERDRLPLLYVDERLAVVAGLWVAADLAAGPDAAGLVLEWQKPSASDNV